MKLTARGWWGLALVVAGAAFALGFFFVPPQVLVPDLLRDPHIQLPEGLVGLWIAGIGVALVVSGRRRSAP